jgi:hypothetical protein
MRLICWVIRKKRKHRINQKAHNECAAPMTLPPLPSTRLAPLLSKALRREKEKMGEERMEG